MTTERPREAAREDPRNAQASRRGASRNSRVRSPLEAMERRKPGTTGEGKYYHVEVRPKSGFKIFRTQDVGERGHIQRVAGQRESGSWATVKWLISKDDAHVSGGRLIGDTKDARDLLHSLGSEALHKSGDRFEAKDRPNIAEKDKPTPAQSRARSRNIKKAQAARGKS